MHKKVRTTLYIQKMYVYSKNVPVGMSAVLCYDKKQIMYERNERLPQQRGVDYI